MNKKTEEKNNKKYISKYFDKDLFKIAEEMTGDEMVELLKELEETRYWVAVTKYVQDRLLLAHGSLCAIDPVKNPTDIARAQGIISGLMDLQDMITKSKETTKMAERKAQQKNDASPDMPPEDEEPSYNN